MPELTVIAIDDNGTTLRLIKKALETEYEVLLASSGQRALKMLKDKKPDLILLDIMMPEMDGFETYKLIRQQEKAEKRNPAPVIFLTSEGDSDTERRGLKIGAADFIQKPFNEDILKKRIQNTIESTKAIENLTKEATVDKLTGLLNKAVGTKKISDLCKKTKGFLAIIDLDNFKLVNDLYGHDAGDQVLKRFSEIVKNSLRETDTVCRIGGDEFLVFLRGMTEKSALSALVKRINRQVKLATASLIGKENGIPIGISMGAVLVPLHGRQYESLFAMADHALYTVKQNGKHGLSVYENPGAEETAAEESPEYEIDRISKIIGERNEKGGALLLGEGSFSTIFRFIMRFYKRYGGSAAKILFTVHVKNEEDDLQETASQFGLVLQHTLRQSDLILQTKSNQFFILLTERKGIEIKRAIERIMNSWKETDYAQNAKVRYSVKEENFTKKEAGA